MTRVLKPDFSTTTIPDEALAQLISNGDVWFRYASAAVNGKLTGTPTGARVYTFPDASGTVVLDSATQTLSGKTITGTWRGPVYDKGGAVFNVKHPDFGAAGDGVTDDTAAILLAIAACVTVGGGTVLLPAGTYIVSKITLPSAVYLVGVGRFSTWLKMADGTDGGAVVETDNFTTQTGQNKWFVAADDVRYGFGLMHLGIDGNKANNTAGRGVNFYGKNYLVYDVLIKDCDDEGFYSECGQVTGQTTDPDFPEAQVETLWVMDCDSHGIQFRGPHDAGFDRIFSFRNGGWGFRAEFSAGVYSGHCEILHIHTYANTSGGTYLGAASITAGLIQADGDCPGVEVAGADCQIGQIKGLNIGATAGETGTVGVLLSGADAVVGTIRLNINTGETGKTGVKITGVRCAVGVLRVKGNATDTVGLDVDANSVSVNGGFVDACTAVGGVGLRIGATGARTSLNLALTVSNCATLVNYANASSNGCYRLTLFNANGQTTWAGNAPTTTDVLSISKTGGTAFSYPISFQSGAFAIDSTGIKTVTVAHNLPFTPSLFHVQVSVMEQTDVDDWAYNLLKVESVDATNVVCKINVSTASGTGAATARLALRVGKM